MHFNYAEITVFREISQRDRQAEKTHTSRSLRVRPDTRQTEQGLHEEQSQRRGDPTLQDVNNALAASFMHFTCSTQQTQHLTAYFLIVGYFV